jgi:hypothetical protein
MVKVLIFGLMLHFVCFWLNRIWMKDSYLVALLIFGTLMIMKG